MSVPFYKACVLLELTGCQVKISLNSILFNIFKPHTVSRYNELLMLLINLVKFCIWTLRNQAKHEFLKVTHIRIKTMLIRTLRLDSTTTHNGLPESKTYITTGGEN